MTYRKRSLAVISLCALVLFSCTTRDQYAQDADTSAILCGLVDIQADLVYKEGLQLVGDDQETRSMLHQFRMDINRHARKAREAARRATLTRYADVAEQASERANRHYEEAKLRVEEVRRELKLLDRARQEGG